MTILNKAQQESFIKIIEDIIEQARELKVHNYMKQVSEDDYKHSTEQITREAIENFADLVDTMTEEGADDANEASKLTKEESNHDQSYHSNLTED